MGSAQLEQAAAADIAEDAQPIWLEELHFVPSAVVRDVHFVVADTAIGDMHFALTTKLFLFFSRSGRGIFLSKNRLNLFDQIIHGFLKQHLCPRQIPVVFPPVVLEPLRVAER